MKMALRSKKKLYSKKDVFNMLDLKTESDKKGWQFGIHELMYFRLKAKATTMVTENWTRM